MAIKTTKNILQGIILLLTILFFIQACEKGDSALIGTHILKKDVTKKVNENGNKIEMTVFAFEDNRCPTNANCITIGYVMVKIKFKDNGNEQELALCSGCSAVVAKVEDVITLNGINYKVKLEDVLPYPVSGNKTPQTSKAYITVSKAAP